MKDKIISLKKDNGKVTIINPAPEMFDAESATRGHLRSKGIDFNSDQEVMDYIISRNKLAGQEYRLITRDKIPVDRTFRDAWTDDLDTDTVDVDITKARDIHVNNLRKIRNKKLEKLDIETMKAVGAGDDEKKAEVETKKQALRDMPEDIADTINNIDNPEDLKLYKPDILED